MPVPVSLSKGRHDPASPYYREPEREPDPDHEYEKHVEKQIEEELRKEREAKAVTEDSQ